MSGLRIKDYNIVCDKTIRSLLVQYFCDPSKYDNYIFSSMVYITFLRSTNHKLTYLLITPDRTPKTTLKTI